MASDNSVYEMFMIFESVLSVCCSWYGFDCFNLFILYILTVNCPLRFFRSIHFDFNFVSSTWTVREGRLKQLRGALSNVLNQEILTKRFNTECQLVYLNNVIFFFFFLTGMRTVCSIVRWNEMNQMTDVMDYPIRLLFWTRLAQLGQLKFLFQF